MLSIINFQLSIAIDISIRVWCVIHLLRGGLVGFLYIGPSGNFSLAIRPADEERVIRSHCDEWLVNYRFIKTNVSLELHGQRNVFDVS